MKYKIVSVNEFLYPDVIAYASEADEIIIHSPRASYASAQILLNGLEYNAGVNLSVSGEAGKFACEIYEQIAVFVEDNTMIDDEKMTEHCPVRKGPFYIYDCLKPLENEISPKDGAAALYICFEIDRCAREDLCSGTVNLNIDGEIFNIPLSINVYKATVPEQENIKIINGYSRTAIASFNGIYLDSNEAKDIDAKALRMLRRMRQNMVYIGGVKQAKDENGNYSFDFSKLSEDIKFYQSFGIKYFSMAGVGFRRSWKEATILVGPERLEAMSYEAYLYLSQYLTALRKFLIENNLMDFFYMGVADEPNKENETEFRALCGLVHKLIPEMKLMDAVSYGNLHGALDVWIPLNAEYDKHMKEFESFRSGGAEIWHYVCCGPRGEEYINRLMDYPLLSTRYLFYGNYKYDLKGYLHWSANHYQPNQNPFTNNNPEHHNADAVCYLPAGDTQIIYPGKNEPWMSIRLEAQRQSAEEFELLNLLAKSDKQKADEICDMCFRSFKDVEYDPVKFENARIKLLKAVSELA